MDQPICRDARSNCPSRETDCHSCQSRDASFCRAVPEHELGILSESRTLLSCRRHKTIVCEGEPATHFFNVVSGMVKLYRIMPDGRTQIVGFRMPGEFFALSGKSGYTATAEAITDVELCRFSHEKLRTLQEEFPDVRAKMLDLVKRQLDACEDQLLLLGCKTAREKVASFLHLFGGRISPSPSQGLNSLTLPISRGDMADFLGLTIETVSRILGGFAEEGLITLGKSRAIRIVDQNAIRLASEGTLPCAVAVEN